MKESKFQEIVFHHVGIPITENLPDETYNPELKMHATGYFESPYAIEWMEFDKDSSLPENYLK